MAVCPADTNEPPRVLNYLTAPHVYVWSAVSCSSAFPLLFEPQELYARDHHGHTVKCARVCVNSEIAVMLDVMDQQQCQCQG